MHIPHKTQKPYEVVIQPNKSWFYFDWQGLIQHRDLLYFLVRRDFISRYQQTILGPAWFIISPLISTVIFTIVFGNIAKIPTDNIPPMIFYLCGLSIWNYFAACLSNASTTLLGNAYLFGKVYFPRLIPSFAAIISQLFTLILQMMTFLGFFFYFKFFTPAGALIHPNAYVLMLPVLVIHAALLALGVGLWFSAMTVKYRDLNFLLGLIFQLWMYATPIIYPLSLVSGRMKLIIQLNPMSSIVEMFKYAFFGVGQLDLRSYALSVVITIIALISGVLVFNRAERTFIDTV